MPKRSRWHVFTDLTMKYSLVTVNSIYMGGVLLRVQIPVPHILVVFNDKYSLKSCNQAFNLEPLMSLQGRDQRLLNSHSWLSINSRISQQRIWGRKKYNKYLKPLPSVESKNIIKITSNKNKVLFYNVLEFTPVRTGKLYAPVRLRLV